MTPPVVSIVSPLYNAARWLPGLVAVTRAQSCRDFQHILVDDCSTDGSFEAAQELVSGDERYVVLRMARNGGPAAARNMAIRHASGRYLAFLDADDQWLPNKLERQLAWMASERLALSYHDYRFLSEDGQRVGCIVEAPDTLDIKTLHTRRGVGCLTVMVDREQVPGFIFPEVSRSLPEDHFAWLSVLQLGHVGRRLPQDLARYRVFQGSRSGNKFRAAKVMWQMFRDVEKLSWPRAANWWLQYAWNAYRMHRRAQPVLPVAAGEPALPAS